jgi:hypothetical protein
MHGLRKAFLDQAANEMEALMRILAGGRVVGLDQCPGFDCSHEPLPLKLQILLCLVDGAERRRQIQAKLNALHPPGDGSNRPA